PLSPPRNRPRRSTQASFAVRIGVVVGAEGHAEDSTVTAMRCTPAVSARRIVAIVPAAGVRQPADAGVAPWNVQTSYTLPGPGSATPVAHRTRPGRPGVYAIDSCGSPAAPWNRTRVWVPDAEATRMAAGRVRIATLAATSTTAAAADAIATHRRVLRARRTVSSSIAGTPGAAAGERSRSAAARARMTSAM